MTPAICFPRSKVDKKLRSSKALAVMADRLKSIVSKTVEAGEEDEGEDVGEICHTQKKEPQIDPLLVKQLIDFGFEERHAIVALRHCGGDAENALQWLCSEESIKVLEEDSESTTNKKQSENVGRDRETGFKIDVDASSVKQLVDFGFEKAHAVVALGRFGGNVDDALSWLCSEESLEVLNNSESN